MFVILVSGQLDLIPLGYFVIMYVAVSSSFERKLLIKEFGLIKISTTYLGKDHRHLTIEDPVDKASSRVIPLRRWSTPHKVLALPRSPPGHRPAAACITRITRRFVSDVWLRRLPGISSSSTETRVWGTIWTWSLVVWVRGASDILSLRGIERKCSFVSVWPRYRPNTWIDFNDILHICRLCGAKSRSRLLLMGKIA